jgi:hypothetical protein
MTRTTKLLATVAAVGTMAIAAVPATSQAAPGDFSGACSALGLPSATTPINLGALGSVTITTCTAAVLGSDPCPGPSIPLNTLLPGLLSLKGNICVGI